MDPPVSLAIAQELASLGTEVRLLREQVRTQSERSDDFVKKLEDVRLEIVALKAEQAAANRPGVRITAAWAAAILTGLGFTASVVYALL